MKLTEITTTLHGEFPFMGEPTIIVRFSGCNLKCSYCDTKHSNYVDLSLEAVVETIKQIGLRNILFTGGEPALHKEDILDIIKTLNKELQSYTYVLETNGTIYSFNLISSIDYVVMDIKEELGITESNQDILSKLVGTDVVKFVFTDITSAMNQWNNFIQLYKDYPLPIYVFSPSPDMYQNSDFLINVIITFKREHPEVKLKFQVQLHKVLNIA